jgi:hypothetical protein
VVKKISRLRRVAEGEPSVPMGLLIKDIEKKIVDKDKIEDITYGPSISREWEFEKPLDNMEWRLQQSFFNKK